MKETWKLPETDAFYVDSLCSYYEGDLYKAIFMLELGLSVDPDHKKSKCLRSKLQEQFERKKSGKKYLLFLTKCLNVFDISFHDCFERMKFPLMKKNILSADIYFSNQKFNEAEQIYTEALNGELSDNLFVFELLYSRAKVRSKIGYYGKAVIDCSRSLKIKPKHVDLLLLRAECYRYIDAFDNSIYDCESVLKLNAIDQEKRDQIRAMQILSKITATNIIKRKIMDRL